jgi:hypothetical protein
VSKRTDDQPHIAYFNMGPWPLFFGLATSAKAFAREMKRLKVDGRSFQATDRANATMHWIERDGKEAIAIIAFPLPTKGASNEQIAGLVAHEACHVVQQMCDAFNQGDKLGYEAEAYLIQHITQSCLQILLKTNRERAERPL